MTKRQILNHLIFSVSSYSSKSHASWPPLPYHRIASYALIHVTDDAVNWLIRANFDQEEQLLAEIVQGVGNATDSHLVTMFGRSYTLPVFFQRCMVHEVPAKPVYEIWDYPTIGRQHHELLDLLTGNNAARMSKFDEYCTELLGLPSLNKPDIEKLVRKKQHKTLAREQAYIAFRTARLWLRQKLVEGVITRKTEKLVRKRLVRSSNLSLKTKKQLKQWCQTTNGVAGGSENGTV